MFRKKSHIFILLLCFTVITPTCYVGYLYYVVTRDAATRIERGAIDRIIASESYVYYDDGRTPIGAFFEKIHRKYILYNEIPKLFIKALIAAEDKNFFSHKGFDLKAILRALVANLRASEVIQGGSTITQQTAKNIFRRERRSYQAKLKELIQAFLLESRYSKQEILEMYVNQFFVTGYGKGLKIAAQYFFGKDVKDLDLVEAAFIAGSVKGPNRYNPFIKKSRAEKEQAEQLAKLRKDYVLLNMHKLNFVSETEYLKAKNREIPFNQGKITYKLNVVLDYIREQLQSPYFRMILEEQGIENPATSGIGIYTSINKEIQESALRSLRTHLPLLDVNLNGYDGGNLGYPKQELVERTLNKSNDNMPFLGRITQIDPEKENAHLVVSWDDGGSIIDYEGLKSIGEAWIKWKMGNWARFDKKYVPTFLKNFRVGDPISLQMMPSQKSDDEIKLMLSKVPELEGAVVVLHGGMLKAMVGGFFNRFFNRAADAKRQLGSIFKPLVYTAALQLKWNSLDALQNTRDVFQYQNTAYVPRPDHPPKSERVSMAWAGIKSENLATVWLLYHLTDHLNMSEFRQITELVGLARRKGESYRQYKERIRDRYGVVVTEEALMEAAFEQAKKEIESDVIFAGSEKMLSSLHRLHFKIEENPENIETTEDRQFLRFSFRRLQEINQRMKGQFYQIVRLLELYGQNYSPHLRESLDQLLRNFYRIQDEGQTARIVYTETPEFLSAASLLPLTPESMLIQHTPLSDSDIWVDGLITSEILETLRENVEKNFDRLLTLKRYELEVLSQVRDFRTLVNLSYVLHLSKNIGISTKLDPVLSFPLGPNSINIMEGATAYQTLMTGQIYPLSSRNGLETTMAPIIEKIVDREGEILWEYRPTPKRILSKRVCGLVTEILRKVMETGTGREARDAVQVFDIPIPTFGKTGTANRFTNSSFIGFLPGSDEETGRLEMEKGYVIASYVGYDDNRPMKGEHLAIYGASGAMPIWIDTANAIANSEDYRTNLQPADLAFNPLPNFLISQGGFVNLPISPVTGLPVSPSAKPAGASSLHSIMGEAEDRGDTWRLKRRFEPLEGGKQ
jgi:penicillin-binding protein 1A